MLSAALKETSFFQLSNGTLRSILGQLLFDLGKVTLLLSEASNMLNIYFVR